MIGAGGLECGHESGYHVIDGIVETDEVVLYELQHGHGCHRFGDAGDLYPVPGLRRSLGFQIAYAVGLRPLALGPADLNNGGHRALVKEELDLIFEGTEGARCA